MLKKLGMKKNKKIEAYYFAMCFILPHDLFMVKVCELYGLKAILCDNNKINTLCKYFKEPQSLVKVRINDFIKSQEEKEKEEQTKTEEEKKNRKTLKKVKIKIKRSIIKK